MSYATGWALIRSVRDIMEQTPGFELKKFHDDLLSAGSVALPLVLQSRFGRESFQVAFENLFNS
ncbi:MAG: hypothetical protein KAU21_20610 [Gammaproteobacteria bacterium]|nr:hypothetical protein [Gammaproteobacteria bacterium]